MNVQSNFGLLVWQLVSFVLLVAVLLTIPLVAIFFHSGGFSDISSVTVTSVREQFQTALRNVDPTFAKVCTSGIVGIAAMLWVLQYSACERREWLSERVRVSACKWKWLDLELRALFDFCCGARASSEGSLYACSTKCAALLLIGATSRVSQKRKKLEKGQLSSSSAGRGASGGDGSDSDSDIDDATLKAAAEAFRAGGGSSQAKSVQKFVTRNDMALSENTFYNSLKVCLVVMFASSIVLHGPWFLLILAAPVGALLYFTFQSFQKRQVCMICHLVLRVVFWSKYNYRVVCRVIPCCGAQAMINQSMRGQRAPAYEW